MTNRTGRPRGRPPGRKLPAQAAVRLPSDVMAAFYAYARERGTTPSAVLREFVTTYVRGAPSA
jgi:hypothetical protein